MARSLARVFLSAVLLLSAGCAKVPSSVNAGLGGQLLVTMTVNGAINPDMYYFVVFNTSNDPTGTVGPVPVIAPPWGNGFIAGAATQFVEFHRSLPGDGYAVYNFLSGTSLQQYTALGVPTQDTPITTGSKTLQFTIPLSFLQTSAIPTANIHNIQVNFLATDRLPTNPTDTSPKLFDALGDPTVGQLNDYITISTDQATTYDNSTRNIEPQGDVQQTTGSGGYIPATEPDLDIVGWSVQIVRAS